MRILVTIPHAFFDMRGDARHGSESGDRDGRAAVVLRCVSALHQAFGLHHRLIGPDDPACNTGNDVLAVVLCTSGSQHLVDLLPPGLIHHHEAGVHPKMLGFACQRLLKANLGRFDWYGYLEDDIELTDGLFFDKLAWFNASFGPGAMLQPNRYEVSSGPVPKLYIDGALNDPGLVGKFQDVTVRPRLMAQALGRNLVFRRTPNCHAGCFFADAAQMAVMAAHPDFGSYSKVFHGPLETAASLPPMLSFDVYKPDRRNASFLEVRHLDQQFLDVRIQYTLDGSDLRKTVGGPPQ